MRQMDNGNASFTVEYFFRERKAEKERLYWYGAASFQREGKTVPIEIGQIGTEENERLREMHTDANGILHVGAYLCALVCACVIFPDLKSEKLQDSWGVLGEEALIRKMLSAGEYFSLCSAVLEYNDFPDRLQKLYEQAKK